MNVEFGFVYDLPEGGKQGRVYTRDNTERRFRVDEHAALQVGDTVTFVSEEGRGLVTGVKRYAAEEIGGRIIHTVEDRLDPTKIYGFIVRLDGGGQAWLSGRLRNAQELKDKARVSCLCCDGTRSFADRRFVMWFRPLGRESKDAFSTAEAREEAVVNPGADVGGYSQKGTRVRKSKNDDAFLVREMVGGAAFLIAVADGVSQPSKGWRAADIAICAVWETLPRAEQAIGTDLTVNEYEALMQEWIDDIHIRFRSRISDFVDQGTSTLTMALVTRSHIHWASCGDCRIYVRKSRGRPKAVIEQSKIDTQRQGTNRLTSHINSTDATWAPEHGSVALAPGDIVFVCSDGMVGGGNSLAKMNMLDGIEWREGSLQDRVESCVRQVAALGEEDDFTLIAFRWKEE